MLKWIAIGLTVVLVLIMFNFYGPLKGSTSSDFESPADIENPLPECPDSPNCVRVSVPSEQDEDKLFENVLRALGMMNAHEVDSNSQQLHVNAIFRIPLFGFLDDVVIKIDSYPTGAVAHIRSSSREGHSDLGVNRRRVATLLSNINS